MTATDTAARALNAWETLEQLSIKAQEAQTEQALAFVVANDTHALLPYRSALVFTVHHGQLVLGCASGLTSVDRHSAFGSWSEQALQALLPSLPQRNHFTADDLPHALRGAWQDYWPEAVHVHALAGAGGEVLGAVVYVPDVPWPTAMQPLLNALHRLYGLCLQNLRAQRRPLGILRQVMDGRNLKTRKYLVRGLVVLLLALCIPVRHFVIAPMEVISLDTLAVTSPVDGIVADLVAKPNQRVRKGDLLYRLDDTAIRNRLESARQALEVARAEHLAGAHRVFIANERTAEAGVLRGRINERLAEVEFLQDQLAMLDIKAGRDGIAVYGQENDWIGKPVSAGQRIMELADSSKLGVNVWLAVNDAINMQTGESIQLLLHADPLNPMTAKIEQASYQASKSPDGVTAYRVRAILPAHEKVRLGLRGSAKINGDWVALGYFIFRRPLGVVRQWLGV